MSLAVTHAVIHGFEKDQHSRDVRSIVKKEALLNIELPAVVSLVSGIAKLLGKRANAQAWGRFDEERGGPLPPIFRESVSQLHADDVFLRVTHAAVDELIKQAKLKSSSTGSHLLFARFVEDDGLVHFLIAMIKQKGAIQLDENYVPIAITEIDMSKLHHAADVRVSDFLRISTEEDFQTNEEGAEERENYLSFLSQKDETSGYFVVALGCKLGLSARKATESIIKATEDYFQADANLRPHKKRAREELCRYLQERSAAGEPATLEDIHHIVTAVLPPSLSNLTDGLELHYNGGDYKIPSDFYVHTNELRKHTKIVISSEELDLKVRRSLVGRTPNARVYFNNETKSLTIKLSAEQAAKFDSEVE